MVWFFNFWYLTLHQNHGTIGICTMHYGNRCNFTCYNNGPERLPYLFQELQNKYGETYRVSLGCYFQIFSTELSLLKGVFIKQFSNLVDRETNTFTAGYPLYESLLQVSRIGFKGYGWKEIRSVVSLAFTTGKMKLMRPTIHEKMKTFVEASKKRRK